MKPTKQSTPYRYTATAILAFFLLSGLAAAEEEVAADDQPEVASTTPATESEAFSYTFDDIAKNLVLIECKSARGKSAGSGFIAKMDGKTYLFTNQHVILGADSISFTTVKGEQLRPTGVELSQRRDIVRLPLPDREDALEIGTTFGMDMPLAVFGNSEGAGVATELRGKVTGVGAELLEVSAEFVSGNSGSPVLDKDRNVIGIASYVRVSQPSRMTENTRFENKVRRFCYRLDGVIWTPVNWKKYNEEHGKSYRETEALVESLISIHNGLFEDPFGTIPENTSDSELKKWSSEHNRMIKHGGNQLKRDLGNSTEELSTICERQMRRIKTTLGKNDLTEFLRDEYEGFSYVLERVVENLDYLNTKLPSITL